MDIFIKVSTYYGSRDKAVWFVHSSDKETKKKKWNEMKWKFSLKLY